MMLKNPMRKSLKQFKWHGSMKLIKEEPIRFLKARLKFE
jgi:hypothetical protein